MSLFIQVVPIIIMGYYLIPCYYEGVSHPCYYRALQKRQFCFFFIRTGRGFHVKQRTKNATEDFYCGKDVFTLPPTGFGNTMVHSI